MGNWKLRELIHYYGGADIIRDIKANIKVANQGNPLERIRDYTAYGVAVSQRFVPHALGLVGIERIVEGRYVESVIWLASIPLAAFVSQELFPSGEEIKNAKDVVEYLAGSDIIQYIKANEPLVERLEKRNLLSKMMDYQHYFMSFVGRYGINYLHIDGVVRLSKGQYKVAAIELSIGFYRDFFAYFSRKRRLRFIKLIKMINEYGLVNELVNRSPKPKSLDDRAGS